MNTETTGFRSLVQQIQERDQTLGPQVAERERGPAREIREPREPRRDLPRRTRNGRTDGMDAAFPSMAKGETAPSLLGRRWL